MRNLIRKILKESEENEFDWVGDIEPRSDISPGAVYLRFGIHEGTKLYIYTVLSSAEALKVPI